MLQYYHMRFKTHKAENKWGSVDEHGSEMWDAKPTFAGPTVTHKDRLKLLLYPKKFFLYRFIKKAKKAAAHERNFHSDPFRILDIGCGTGAAVVDMKKMFGREVELVGLDVVKMQIDIAEKKVKEYGVHAEFMWYEGKQLPFSDNSFDAVYTSDVLGHVENVPYWLDEINRVLRKDGVVAMFAESKLGKHAWLRRWFLKHGHNTDPHAEFHISLYSKNELRDLMHDSNFEVEKMYSSVWAKFVVHPDELRISFKKYTGWKLLPFKWLNALLAGLKKITHPVSTAICEFYSFVEMVTVGRWVESQGYVILARKKD